MDNGFGADFIELQDEEGNRFNVEHLDTIEFDGAEYMVFVPADMDEDDPDYGLIILRVEEIDGESQLVSIDEEEELKRVYDYYMELIFSDKEEEE